MDQALVDRARRGDQAAFAAIATQSYERLHRLAFAILHDRELARDAVQQAMLEAWRNLPRLRDASRFDAWACRILVHACRAEARRSRRWIPGLRLPDETDASTPLALTERDPLGEVDDRDQLERGFRRLSVDHRVVLALRHYLDLPLDEVAVRLGVPLGTASSRYHRALQALRAALEADGRASAHRRLEATIP